jgi:hypothetical protein
MSNEASICTQRVDGQNEWDHLARDLVDQYQPWKPTKVACHNQSLRDAHAASGEEHATVLKKRNDRGMAWFNQQLPGRRGRDTFVTTMGASPLLRLAHISVSSRTMNAARQHAIVLTRCMRLVLDTA